MKCDECLQSIEEYVDGELDEQTALRLSAHLAGCAPCAEAAEELRLEAEVYRSYDRPVGATPVFWATIKARIEDEKPSRPSRIGVNSFGWLAGTLNIPRLAPILGAIVLVALGIGFGVASFKRSHTTRQTETAVNSTNGDRAGGGDTSQGESANPGAVNSQQSVPANLVDITEKVPRLRRAIVRSRGSVNNQSQTLAAKSRRDAEHLLNQVSPVDVAPPGASVIASSLPASAGTGANRELGDPDAEWRTHAERAQLLLRSFRNIRLDESRANLTQTIDVAYERQLSKKLLYDNIILRRDAAARGDRPAERLLDNLEPLLLDIANLPERPLPRDVRSIEQRLRKEEIVARLQAQSVSAHNTFN